MWFVGCECQRIFFFFCDNLGSKANKNIAAIQEKLSGWQIMFDWEEIGKVLDKDDRSHLRNQIGELFLINVTSRLAEEVGDVKWRNLNFSHFCLQVRCGARRRSH